MMYWGWTAAFIKGGWYQREQLDHPLTRDFLRDIVLLVNQSFWTDWEMDVMQLRTQKMQSNPLGHQTESRFDPPMSIEEWLSNRLPGMMAYYRITIKLGFSLLERLIRRHCDDLDSKGRLTTSDPAFNTYLLPWNDADDPCGEDVKYYDELRLWMNEEAEPKTREALEAIHDLEQPHYDVPTYKEVLESILDSDDLDVAGSDGFLQILKNIRNTDLHGQENAKEIFSSVIVTLCCAVFWDAISRGSFQSHRNGLLDSIGQQNLHRESGAGPKQELDAEVYYPWYNDVLAPTNQIS